MEGKFLSVLGKRGGSYAEKIYIHNILITGYYSFQQSDNPIGWKARTLFCCLSYLFFSSDNWHFIPSLNIIYVKT